MHPSFLHHRCIYNSELLTCAWFPNPLCSLSWWETTLHVHAPWSSTFLRCFSSLFMTGGHFMITAWLKKALVHFHSWENWIIGKLWSEQLHMTSCRHWTNYTSKDLYQTDMIKFGTILNSITPVENRQTGKVICHGNQGEYRVPTCMNAYIPYKVNI